MSKDGADRRREPGRLLCALLAAVLISLLAGAAAAEGIDPLLVDPDVILAKATVEQLDLKAPDGKALPVRRAFGVSGRGASDPAGRAPDYTGVLGYISMPLDPSACESAFMVRPDWQVPVYRISKDGKTMVKSGYAPHKTAVLVTNQRLKYDGKGNYTGWLAVVRLDSLKQCYLHVSCFETQAYWELPLAEIPKHGYSIAVYRESPGKPPMDETGKTYTLRDGTRLLIPYKGACPANSPDPEHMTMQAVVFTHDGTGAPAATVVYFRATDLKTIY